jgi:hypothetical protein
MAVTHTAQARGHHKEPPLSVVVPDSAPVLPAVAAIELLALLLDAHRRLVAEREPTRPEAA